MTKTEKLAILREWAVRLETANLLIDPIADALKLTPESPIHTAIWGLQTVYTKAVGKLVGDKADWLDWYASENDFGRKHMEAGPTGSTRPISALDDLVWVMEVTA